MNHISANLNQKQEKRNSYDELNALARAQLQYLSEQFKELAATIEKFLFMIGKITIGKSFRGCVLYCLNDARGNERKSRGFDVQQMLWKRQGIDKSIQ